MSNMIYEHLRLKNGNRKGMMLAIYDEETKTIKIGWSSCRTKTLNGIYDYDIFNVGMGYTIAAGRANHVLEDNSNVSLYIPADDTFTDAVTSYCESLCRAVPQIVAENLFRFVKRSCRYFKDANFVAVFKGRVRNEHQE